MKTVFSIAVIALLAVAGLQAAQPAAPSGAFVSGLTTSPTTNAISAPAGFFPAALVYNGTNIFKASNSTMFTWTANTEPDLLAYNVYFGDMLSSNAFTKLSLPKSVTSVVLLGLNTNVAYGIYATALNTSAEESKPSTLVVLKPGTP